ncbi:MAG: GTP cyclohydrolase II [Candidatus Thorarchaeota archaeon]|nr:MAG: GTP cyclohydrolase II [Candidatus Thorarchaeota archaeon]
MKLSKETIDYLIKASEGHKCERVDCCVNLVAIADLPSRFGDFQICGFVSPCDGKEHTALVRGDVVDKENVMVRMHSECLTGDVLGSKRCDCRDQLLESLKQIEREGEGVLIYLRQEGRNIGLTEKIRAYALQDEGYDTIDANVILGHQPDERDYGVAAHMLRSLRVRSVRLLTNNPEKIRQLINHGVMVKERIPLVTKETRYNREYIRTKKERAGHLFGDEAGITSVEEIERLTNKESS